MKNYKQKDDRKQAAYKTVNTLNTREDLPWTSTLGKKNHDITKGRSSRPILKFPDAERQTSRNEKINRKNKFLVS